MKLVTYSDKKKPRNTQAGILWGDWILDAKEIAAKASKADIRIPKTIQKLPDKVPTVLELLNQGPRLLDDIKNTSWRIFNRMKVEDHQRLTKARSVNLHSPIPHPPTLRDFYGFEDHVKAARARRGLEMPPEWYEFPAFYYSNPTVIYGPGDDIPRPAYTTALDFELEIACVIGQSGMDIPENEAEPYIAGYTIMNDWSARDIQQREMKIGLGPAKAKDFATSLGPWLVTPDELQDKKSGPAKFDLRMKATVNGKQLSEGNMNKMHWTFSQMVARASQSVELKVGEVFGSGTVGTGSLLELGEEIHRWLKHGDRVELEVERLGVLRNRIIETAES
jgi:2-keto-4-pentenoate hydratase/2-oxohepta-3-ene-1,7-dioic acid hydratase in catechol pathway